MTFKPLPDYNFTILCDACEEETFNPKICHSCGMKESECDVFFNYKIERNLSNIC